MQGCAECLAYPAEGGRSGIWETLVGRGGGYWMDRPLAQWGWGIILKGLDRRQRRQKKMTSMFAFGSDRAEGVGIPNSPPPPPPCRGGALWAPRVLPKICGGWVSELTPASVAKHIPGQMS